MSKIKWLFILIISGIACTGEAQVPLSGVTIDGVSGIVNRYYPITAFTPASGGTCSSPATPASVTIGAPVGSATPASLATGMEVLIIQMKAGSSGVIDRTASSASYGDVSNAGGAGNYEFATIATVVGSTVTFTTTLVNTYDPTGKVQLIPTWLGNTSATNYTTSNTLSAMRYNEVLGLGGIFVLSTTGTLTMNHDILADTMGFQGGDTIGNLNTLSWPFMYIQAACCGSKIAGGGNAMDATNANSFAFPFIDTEQRDNSGTVCPLVANRITKGARKGFGIFGRFSGEELSKGKVANGGGGGHGYNTGGGGGGGYSGGGNGGYELAWACNDGSVGGSPVPAGIDHGGRGGMGFNGGTTAIFMGGGGGAGHGDGSTTTTITGTAGGYPAGVWRGPSNGGDGGGVIIIKANQITAVGTRTIGAKGGDARYGSQDGAGGGGGGGTIILQVPAYSGTLSVNAKGGDGGHVINPNESDCHGTGGGGGGGRVMLSVGSAPAGVTVIETSGAAGKGLRNSGNTLYDKQSWSFCGSNIYWGSNAGVTGNITYATNINTQSCGLPVTLINFYTELLNGNIAGIYWKTSSETNASYFSIERSTDGKTFEEIGTVNAQGNQQEIQFYSFNDHTITNLTGIVYYRLRIVDLDDTYEYSSISAITLQGAVVSVYPSPAKEGEEIYVEYFSYTETEEINLTLFSSVGESIFSMQRELTRGSNTIELNTKNLAAGVYLIQVSSKYGKTYRKILIEY